MGRQHLMHRFYSYCCARAPPDLMRPFLLNAAVFCIMVIRLPVASGSRVSSVKSRNYGMLLCRQCFLWTATTCTKQDKYIVYVVVRVQKLANISKNDWINSVHVTRLECRNRRNQTQVHLATATPIQRARVWGRSVDTLLSCSDTNHPPLVLGRFELRHGYLPGLWLPVALRTDHTLKKVNQLLFVFLVRNGQTGGRERLSTSHHGKLLVQPRGHVDMG